MDEQSIFLNALEQSNPEARAVWLDEACGDDHALKQRILDLLKKHEAAGSFLEKPPEGLDVTIVHESSDDKIAASMNAGLTAAFSINEAIVLGDKNHSVLKMLGNTLAEVPRVSLWESQAQGEDPISRPSSAEMPIKNKDSRYQLQGEIARGGMGAILKGRDTDLGRDLAIKVLLDSHKDNPQVIQRFVEEAQIGGQLQHPGIAPVYELGQFADQRPFFSMKLVKGDTLAKLLAQRSDATVERAKFIGIFEQICQTMAYAHSRGVIHRDLKPANIMVGAFGEVQVMDWGLAKVLQSGGVADEKKAMQSQQGQSIIQTMRSGGSGVPGSFGSTGSDTQMGSVMGTPAYMPPEQALGEIDQLDQRADVFGLGAILTEILTGKPPYVGENGTQVYRMASRGKLEACMARLNDCNADAELIAVAKNCLKLEPSERPADAAELAVQITDYLESVESKLRETELQRASEAARVVEQKKRMRVTIALATSLVLLIGTSAGGWTYLNQKRSAEYAAAAKKAEEMLNYAQTHVAIANEIGVSKEANLERRLSELELARRSAEECFELTNKSSLGTIRNSIAVQLADIEQSTNITKKIQQQRFIDSELVARLNDIRATRKQSYEMDELALNNSAEPYLKAFRDAGIDIENETTDTLSRKLESSTIKEDVLGALDDWTQIHVSHRESIADITQIPSFSLANALDPDQWREQIRTAVATKNIAKLQELVRQREFTAQSPSFVSCVVSVLREAQLFDESIKILHESLLLHPNDFWLNQEMAIALDRTEKRNEALIYRQAAIAARPDNVLEMAWQANELVKNGRFEDAKLLARRILRINAGHAGGNTVLIYVLMQQERKEEAISVINTWTSSKRTDYIDNYMLARKLLEFKRREDAVELCRVLEATVDRGDLLRLAQLGNLCFDLGLMENARSFLDLSVKLTARNQYGVGELASLQRNLGRFEDAIATFELAIKTSPSNPFLFHELGKLYGEAKLHDKAIESYGRAVELLPNANNFASLGYAHLKAGRETEAIAALEQAAALDSHLTAPLTNLGYIYEKVRSDFLNAAITYRRLVDLHPKEVKYRDWLGKMYLVLGRPVDAIAQYTVAAQLDPESKYPFVLRGLGRSHEVVGNHTMAAEAYRRATELSSASSIDFFNYGNNLLADGSVDNAINAWIRCLELEETAFSKGKINVLSFNDFAWKLVATSSQKREPEFIAQAVNWAKRACELEPKNKANFNTLGVALYRAEQWQKSIDALHESVRLGSDDAYNWLFLAMAHWQLDQKDNAKQWYDRALAWQTANTVAAQDDAQLKGFFSEAANLMAADVEAPKITSEVKPATQDVDHKSKAP